MDCHYWRHQRTNTKRPSKWLVMKLYVKITFSLKAACRVWLRGLWRERKMRFIVQRNPIECFWVDVNTVVLKYHVSFLGKEHSREQGNLFREVMRNFLRGFIKGCWSLFGLNSKRIIISEFLSYLVASDNLSMTLRIQLYCEPLMYFQEKVSQQ